TTARLPASGFAVATVRLAAGRPHGATSRGLSPTGSGGKPLPGLHSERDDRDPWNGTLGAVLELESRGLKSLAAIVRRFIGGEQPTPEVRAELDRIISVNGRSGLDSQ